MIAKTQFLKTDFIYCRNQKYLGTNLEYHFSLQTKMFQTRKDGIVINVSILEKTVNVVILTETFYSNKHIYIFFLYLYLYIYKFVSFIQGNTMISG